MKISNLSFRHFFRTCFRSKNWQTTRQLKTASHSPRQGLPLATRNTNGSMLINASATQTRLKSTTQPVMGIETKGGFKAPESLISWGWHWGSIPCIPWNSHGALDFAGSTQILKSSFRHGIFHSIKLQSKAVFANCSLQSLKSSF